MIKKLKFKSKTNYIRALVLAFEYGMRKCLFDKSIVKGTNTVLKLNDSKINGLLKVGLDGTNFTHKYTHTYINIRGSLQVKGNFTIGRGNHFDVGKDAIITLGNNSYINPNGLYIIAHKLVIGSDCAISWNCNFLDEAYHILFYHGKKESHLKGIEIGNKVWVGSTVSIYGGTKIANGCVVGANSVVKGEFIEENCLIIGNPAKVVKRNISWG